MVDEQASKGTCKHSESSHVRPTGHPKCKRKLSDSPIKCPSIVQPELIHLTFLDPEEKGINRYAPANKMNLMISTPQ